MKDIYEITQGTALSRNSLLLTTGETAPRREGKINFIDNNIT